MSEMGMAMMGSGWHRVTTEPLRLLKQLFAPHCSRISTSLGQGGYWSTSLQGLTLHSQRFSQVGSTVEDFASENATVVIGTVIDPDMGDDARNGRGYWAWVG